MDNEFDIVKNITSIEKLKCEILSATSELFTSMSIPNSLTELRKEDRRNILADIIISSYLLSAKLGIEAKEMDKTIMDKLKLLKIADDQVDMRLNNKNISQLYRHIESRVK